MPESCASIDWPHRLLHVASLTSFIRGESNTYNGVAEPKYNILSYTWGRFTDPQGPSLSIHGIDWPIPSVEDKHFTVDEFHAAIRAAASGVDFIWADVACIPQQHKDESLESKRTREVEIGRQIAIFGRASQAFVWLSKVDFATLSDCLNQLKESSAVSYTERPEPSSVDELESWLGWLENRLRILSSLADRVQTDPWFSSLWTLQEAVLRRDAFLISRDGKHGFPRNGETGVPKKLSLVATGERGEIGLKLRFQEDEMSQEDTSSLALGRWTLTELATASGASLTALQVRLDEDKKMALRTAAVLDAQRANSSTLSFCARIEAVSFEIVRVQRANNRRGLTYIGQDLSPNVAYAAAQFREVSNYLDRIYGITQLYGITCSPLPPGECKEERLHNLQTEFCNKLIAFSPLLSQLFIHSSPSTPKRSWMITQQCEVPWFMSRYKHEVSGDSTSCCSMRVLEEGHHVAFVGKGFSFVDVLRSNTQEGIAPGSFQMYLVPDRHVRNTYTSWSFQNPHPALTRWEVPTADCGRMEVLFLGYLADYPGNRSSLWRFYGLVLIRDVEPDSEVIKDGPFAWKRVGLLYWSTWKEHFDKHIRLRDTAGTIK